MADNERPTIAADGTEVTLNLGRPIVTVLEEYRRKIAGNGELMNDYYRYGRFHIGDADDWAKYKGVHAARKEMHLRGSP